MLFKNSDFSVNDEAHRNEHSLEVQLPFLQKVLKDFNIVPLVYGNMNPQDVAEVLKPYLKRKDVLLIVSADLSHYNSYDEALILDAKTAENVMNKEPEIDYHQSCGAGGINTALILSNQTHLHPQVLSLINSGDTSGDKNRVVGYGAWSFEEGSSALEPKTEFELEVNNLQNFAKIYSTDMLDIAEAALTEAVLNKKIYVPSRSDYPDALFDKGATFITLEKNGELRGCIGSLTPIRAIALDVAENAYNAALKDSRFNPIEEDELSDITISISILTSYDNIAHESEADLLSKITPNVDGIVIRDGYRQALYLPSVWKQLPNKKDFINNLKMKAGMSPTYWSNDMKVYRFRTVEIKQNAN